MFGDGPTVGEGTFISPSSVVMGNVTLGKGVFVAPHATIRCDEPGSEIIIQDHCNIQDNVVVHGLAGSKVVIGERCSIGHGAIVHGPCMLGSNSFVGFGSVLFDCEIGSGSMVMHKALVEDCELASGTLVPSGSVVKGRVRHMLPKVGESEDRFRSGVQANNGILVEKYRNCSNSRISAVND